MAHSRRSLRNPRADVLAHLHQLERLCRGYERERGLASFGTLARLLASIAGAFGQGGHEALWLFEIATLTRRQAEASVLRRLRAIAANGGRA